MERGYFKSDVYNTPEREKLRFIDRLRFNNRLYFICKYATIAFRTRRQAKQGRYGNREWEDSSYYIFRFIEKCGGIFHLSGMENILKVEEPVLFVGNHMSTLETMILPCIISPLREVTFVVKDSLVTHPLFKDVMLSRNPIVVGRKDPRKDFETVINEGTERLDKGISIVIFPQSTRSLEFIPEKFNTIGVKLAQKAKVKIVPVALKTDFWGNGKIIKEIGAIDRHKHIYIRFGEPFEPTGMGKTENHKIIDFIRQSLDEWNNR